MRHFLMDWRQWTIPERITAVALALCAVTVPAALATVI
jgi:hypothetical protein